MVLVDPGTGALFASGLMVGDNKTDNEADTVSYLNKWLDRYKYTDVKRSENEGELKNLLKRLKASRLSRTILEGAPTRSPQSVGAAERAVRTIK